jgi:molecular chaperone GrpE (heat shock protein)
VVRAVPIVRPSAKKHTMNSNKTEEKQTEAEAILRKIDSLARQIKELGNRYSQIQEEIQKDVFTVLQLEEEEGPRGPH